MHFHIKEFTVAFLRLIIEEHSQSRGRVLFRPTAKCHEPPNPDPRKEMVTPKVPPPLCFKHIKIQFWFGFAAPSYKKRGSHSAPCYTLTNGWHTVRQVLLSLCLLLNSNENLKIYILKTWLTGFDWCNIGLFDAIEVLVMRTLSWGQWPENPHGNLQR